MSDLPARPDELVSACLDSEATPDELALVEQDDALKARAAQLRAARDAVAAPVPPPAEAQRDLIIGTAVAAAEEALGARGAAPRGARAPAPAAAGSGPGARDVLARRRRLRRPLLAAAAAVAVLAAVAGGSLLADRLGGGDRVDVASMALEGTAHDAADDLATADRDAARAPADSDAAAAAEESPQQHLGLDVAADEAETPAGAATAPMPESGTLAQQREEQPSSDEAAEAAALPERAPAADQPTEPQGGEHVDEDTLDEETELAAGDSGEPATSDGSADTVLDLGALDDIDSLFELLGGATPPPHAMPGEPGACSTAVGDRVRDRGAEPVMLFVAALAGETPTILDVTLARLDDGAELAVYAAAPDCAPATQRLNDDARG